MKEEWTKEEELWLAEVYPKEPTKYLPILYLDKFQKLRSYKSLERKAEMLKLKKETKNPRSKKYHKLTKPDEDFIKAMWKELSDDELKKILKVTKQSIKKFRSINNLKRVFHTEKTPEEIKAMKQKHNKARALVIKERKEYLNNIKATKGCYFCGEKDPVVLDFHHINPQNKSFAIASGIGRKLETLNEEIDKCIVVCSNCHRKLHAGRLEVKSTQTLF